MANAHSRQGAIRMFFVEQHTWLLNYVGPGSPETSVHNAPDSRLRYPWIPYSLSCLRPGTSRTELSVLGRALFRRSDPGQLGSHPRRKARFQGKAPKNPQQEEMTDRPNASKTLIS